MGGAINEQDEVLAWLTDLNVTWGVDLHAFLRDRSHKAPVAGDAGDLHVCLPERSQEAPVAGGAGDGTAETMDSSQGDALDASSAPTGKTENDSNALSTSGTDQGNGEEPPTVLSAKAAKGAQ